MRNTLFFILILSCVGFATPFTKSLEKLGYVEPVSLNESPRDLQGPILTTVLIEGSTPSILKSPERIGYIGKDSVELLGNEEGDINMASGFGANRMTHYVFLGGESFILFITKVTDTTLTPYGRYYCEAFFYSTNNWLKFFMK